MKLPTTMIALLFSCCALNAAKFAFDDSNAVPVMWIVHVGTNSGAYTSNIFVSSNSITIPSGSLFIGKTNFAIVTAILQSGAGVESDPSNEISFFVPVAPRNFRLSLESGETPSGPWGEVACLDYLEETPATTRFYRGKVLLQ